MGFITARLGCTILAGLLSIIPSWVLTADPVQAGSPVAPPHSIAPAAAGAALPEGEPGWRARVQQDLAEREYGSSDNGVGLQAPNRRHNLRTYFGPSGIRVHDRTGAGSPELLGLSLVGWGRGGALAPVDPGEVRSEGARVEIRRPGLVEWYVNSPAGLEQGFTLPARPAGEGALVLELAVEHASASLVGEQVVLASTAGRRLAYGKLAVVDATGAAVAAKLYVPDPGRVRLVVTDVGAKYPLTIDPLLTEAANTQLESNQAHAYLGTSVAGAGDVNGDGYDDVIVGARSYDAGLAGEGAAFVFLGSASGVADGTPATAATQLESDQATGLGWSVAGAGDVNGDGYDDVIVGAPYYDAGQDDVGAAFVFLGGASGIPHGNPATAATRLVSDQADALLGWSVAGAGDVNGDGYDDVIVGAWPYDAGQDAEGAAFVFLGSASGIADGNPAAAAARLESDQTTANLGRSVAGAGDVNGDGYDDVIVGASDYKVGQIRGGAAFVFLGSASGIADGNPATAATRLVEADQERARLGYSVAGAGDVNGDGYDDVIVGVRGYDAGLADEGAAFVFLGSASGIADGTPATAATQLESNQEFAHLGIGVAGAGDVNGDGYDDVIVGGHFFDAGQSDEGAAFVFLGSASGIADGNPATAATQIESNQEHANLGPSLAGAGDVNGDGYDDVIVGASDYDAGQDGEGAAFVFLGSASGIVVPALCAVEATAPVYVTGDQIGLSTLSFSNPTGEVIPGGRLRLELRYEGFPVATLIDAGPLNIPSPFEIVAGPIGLFQIGAPLPRGTWSLHCEVRNGVGTILNDAQGFFEVVP